MSASNASQEKRSRTWIVWVIVAAVVLGAILWFSTRPPQVTVAEVRRGDLPMTVTATGEVDGHVAELSSTVQGQVEAVYVDEGARVARGDLLARIAGMSAPGVAAAAQTALETIEAPFDGVVSRRWVDPGDAAIPGQPLFQVADTEQIWVTALVDDIDVGKIREGQPATIVLPSYLGRNLRGEIVQIAATATPRTESGIGGQIVRTRVELTNGTGPLRPGMEVDVTVESVGARDVVLAPADAIIEDQTGRWVLKVVDNTVQRQPVELGANNYVHAEIRDGLQPGDLVVVEGKEDVRDGDRVRTVERDERE